jgi:glycosyltransferase involved in cell wall biosynthesis
VARDGAVYFTTADDAEACISAVLDDPHRRAEMALASRARHVEEFTWEHVAGQYEALLRRFLPDRGMPLPSRGDTHVHSKS